MVGAAMWQAGQPGWRGLPGGGWLEEVGKGKFLTL